MIQIIPETRDVRIKIPMGPKNNPEKETPIIEFVIGYVIYTGEDLSKAPYEADDSFYVQPITTLDCMEHLQKSSGNSVEILVNEEPRDDGYGWS